MATRLFNAIVVLGTALTAPVTVGCGDEVSQPHGGASGRVPSMPTVQDADSADDAAVDDAATDGPGDAGTDTAMSTDAAIDVDAAWPTTK